MESLPGSEKSIYNLVLDGLQCADAASINVNSPIADTYILHYLEETLNESLMENISHFAVPN